MSHFLEPHSSWRSARGEAVFRTLCPTVIHVQYIGYLELAFVEGVFKTIESLLLRRVGKLEVFTDAYQLEGYSSEARILATRWIQANRERLGSQHILFRSKLVAMGIAVLNLPLGGFMKSYSDPELFQIAMQKSVIARR